MGDTGFFLAYIRARLRGLVKLATLVTTGPECTQSRRELCSLTPRSKGLGSKLAMGRSRDQVTAGRERIGDGGMGSEETLGRARRAEAFTAWREAAELTA